MLWVYRVLWVWDGSKWNISAANFQKEDPYKATSTLSYSLQSGPPFYISQVYVYLPSKQWHLYQDVGNWSGGPNHTETYKG